MGHCQRTFRICPVFTYCCIDQSYEQGFKYVQVCLHFLLIYTFFFELSFILRLQVQLKHNFITKNGFDKISTSDDYWKWIHKTAITEIKAAAWYNGQPPYGLRGFIGFFPS